MIRYGRMIPGATPLGIGINGSVEGMAAFDDGEFKVIAKRISDREIATELFCSLLARELVLPVAPPALLVDTDGTTLMFASLDDGYPNFAQAICLDVKNPDGTAMKRFYEALRNWSSAAEVASFDVWIDNRDRNPSNWLWRDCNDWLLIDHGKALGCDPTADPINKLHAFLMAAFHGNSKSIATLKRAMMGAMMGFSTMHSDLAKSHMPPIFTAAAADFCAMLSRDFPNLSVNIGNLFPGQGMLT